MHGDLAAEPEPVCQPKVVPAPETARVIPVRLAATGQQPHGLVGHRQHLRAVSRLQIGAAVLVPAGRDAGEQPPRGERGRGRKRSAIQPRDRLQHGVFHLAGDHGVQLAQPRPLTVPSSPDDDRLAQVMQLDPAVAGPGPHIRQGAAKLGMPHQRGQVLDGDCHADVVDRAVGRDLDRPVGHLVAAKQPHVTGARQIHGLIEANARGGHVLT